jgi:aminomethyltransferase
MEAGKKFNLQPGHTSSIRRIEGGMLSYHADADINTNPFELGMDRLVNLDNDNKFIGKDALIRIKEIGIKRKQVGMIIDCDPLEGPNTTFWPILKNNNNIGKVTSAVYSPRLKENIALGMVTIENSEIDNSFDIKMPYSNNKAKVVLKPFYDPKKNITSKSL